MFDFHVAIKSLQLSAKQCKFNQFFYANYKKQNDFVKNAQNRWMIVNCWYSNIILNLFFYNDLINFDLIIYFFFICSLGPLETLPREMVSRRKILSRSRDDLNLEHQYQQQDDEEDIWYQKDKLYKVSSNFCFSCCSSSSY